MSCAVFMTVYAGEISSLLGREALRFDHVDP